MISETSPVPMRMPSFGNRKLATSAPAMPNRMSPMMPNPVPRTILPASQPATRPTNRMTRMPSLEICMKSPLFSPARTLAAIAGRDEPVPRGFHHETFALQPRYGFMTKPDTWYVAFSPDKNDDLNDGAPR